MEDLYLKGFYGRREWCSEKVKLNSYFENYRDALSEVSGTKGKSKFEIDILNHFVPEAEELSPEEIAELAEVTNWSKLTTLCDDDLVKNSSKENNGKTQEKDPESNEARGTELLFTENKSSRKNRVKYQKNLHLRREIPLDSAEKCGMRNLKPREDFLVSFRIHDPFSHRVGDNSRPGRCAQEIYVLGHQSLTDLRDKIICESDFQDIRGDVSECPEAPLEKISRDICYSGMFYFDNTYYVDLRHKSNVDYSVTVKEWAKKRGLTVGLTKSMEYCMVQDLEVRFGYPYLYTHQGCCEHLVVINEARLVTARDSLYSLDYPLIQKVTHHNMVYCMLCTRLPAKWIVRGCNRLAHDPTLECSSCFKLFHYINGKKVGQFKAFKFWQKGTIL